MWTVRFSWLHVNIYYMLVLHIEIAFTYCVLRKKEREIQLCSPKKDKPTLAYLLDRNKRHTVAA